MAPIRIIPILFLDLFKVHLLDSIANAIQGLGVELEIIPLGCTSLVQPIDVRINKPFKANMEEDLHGVAPWTGCGHSHYARFSPKCLKLDPGGGSRDQKGHDCKLVAKDRI